MWLWCFPKLILGSLSLLIKVLSLHTDSRLARGEVLPLRGAQGGGPCLRITGWGLELVLFRNGKRNPYMLNSALAAADSTWPKRYE